MSTRGNYETNALDRGQFCAYVVFDRDNYSTAALPVVQPVVGGDDIFRYVFGNGDEVDAFGTGLFVLHFERFNAHVFVADGLVKQACGDLGVCVNARVCDGFRKRLVRLYPKTNG